jgi:hypothetical protein
MKSAIVPATVDDTAVDVIPFDHVNAVIKRLQALSRNLPAPETQE